MFLLVFAEVPADPQDLTLSTIEANAEPLAPPALEPAADAPRAMSQSWVWRILLRGDGWLATWYSPRPAIGRVQLTGRLIGDFAYATTGSVRGQVLTARVLDGAGSAGRHEPGILAALDLDDVPPLPIRPSFTPRAISAAGRALWAADEQLPLIVRVNLDNPADVCEIVLPTPIAPEPGRTPWQLHADPNGCWIAGWYGTFRAADTGAVQRLDDCWVDASAAYNGTLLTCTSDKTATRISLRYPDDREPHHDDTTLPAGPISAVIAHDDGFRILMRRRDMMPTTTFVVDVTVDGHVTVGPPLDDIDDYAILTTEPPAIIDLRGTIRTLRSDLQTDSPARWPLPGLSGGTVGNRIWIEHHDRDRDLHDNREYWLLSLTDFTGQVIARAEIQNREPGVTIDSSGTAWITDGHITAVHTPNGTLPPPLPLADLLDHNRSYPPHTK